jgi:hypothetical protein
MRPLTRTMRRGSRTTFADGRRASVARVLAHYAIHVIVFLLAMGATNPARIAAAGGWEITVYYTAVESFHTGAATTVRGCLTLACTNGNAVIGTYPSDFVNAVQDEGTGRITSGTHAGAYLNWSVDVGYWLDSAPRDARGQPLQSYRSAAADVSVAFGTVFSVTNCGKDSGSNDPIDAAFCTSLKQATWVVQDRFSEGTVGQHVDLYIGEEDQANFVNTSPKEIDTTGATLAFGTPTNPAPQTAPTGRKATTNVTAIPISAPPARPAGVPIATGGGQAPRPLPASRS